MQDPVCLVGHAIVDVSLGAHRSSSKMRLGGVFHMARMLWALECPFTIAYLGPAYLDEAVQQFAAAHRAIACSRIGDVAGSPNVVLVREPTEAGQQGYEDLLRDKRRATVDERSLEQHLSDNGIREVVCVPNQDEAAQVLGVLLRGGVNVHLDANSAGINSAVLSSVTQPLATLALSVSSPWFLESWSADPPASACRMIPNAADAVLLKENRGGSRYFSADEPPILTPAHVRSIVHSVGVGDGFLAGFVHLQSRYDVQTALAYGSLLASEYAATTYPGAFFEAVKGVMRIPADEVRSFRGVALPWESRERLNIYVAAPDFDFVDTQEIDKVEECLKYHNFSPRRPVRENGQLPRGATRGQRSGLASADMDLLGKCRIMVAVLLYDDPGTLIEIGIALERQIPVVVYDPFRIARNLILTEMPYAVTRDADRLISAVFEVASQI